LRVHGVPSRSFRPACVFFFQAEDGIRAPLVTGVQTCALPIWMIRGRRLRSLFVPARQGEQRAQSAPSDHPLFLLRGAAHGTVRRSEERRGGTWCWARAGGVR